MKSQTKILVCGIVCAALAVVQAVYLFQNGHFYHHTIQIILGWGVGMTAGLALLTLHIASFRCSAFASTTSILIKYIFHWVTGIMQAKDMRAFRGSTKNCTKNQTDLLMKKIRENESTVYGVDYTFKEIKSVDDFIKKHPLTSYEHYTAYVNRVANGELGVMTRDKPSILGKTSGTTGVAKMLPVGKECLSAFMGRGNSVTQALRRDKGLKTPGSLQMGSSLQVGAYTDVSEGGIPVGPITTFLITDQVKELLFATPVVGFHIMHEPTSMYVHALFALRDENLGSIWTPFASSLFLFFRFLEVSWHMLVQDIRQGTISSTLQILTNTEREALGQELMALPDRANELERQFRKGFDNIAARLWPHMPVLYTVTSGSMQTFTRRLRKYTGDLPLLSGYYVSTEGILGYALDFPMDGQTKYVCIPNDIFYEFIPADFCDEQNPGTLLMEEVRLGESYELVITNMDGLYRYRMGDVIKITGFFNKAPIFQFQYRNGELLNIRAEKTSEVAVTKALQDTVEKWEGVKLTDYVCAESPLYEEAADKESDARMLYYVVLAELVTPKDSELMSHTEEREKFEAEFDANLRTVAAPYDKCRQKKALGAPRVIFLDALAFSEFRVYLLETSKVSAGQLKIPRKLRKLEWVKLFLHHELQCTSKPFDV